MRYIVWACFGVDAESPEQAKMIVTRITEATTPARMDLYDHCRVNTTIFISPELDKMLDEIGEE